MKPNKLFVLIPLVLLVLSSCAKGDTGVNGNNGDSTSNNGDASNGEVNHTKAQLPLRFDPTQKFSAGSGWNYITNNNQYPDPTFYDTDGAITGLKLAFPNMGLETYKFDAVDSLKVTLNVKKLNRNTKSSDDSVLNVFEVEGYNANNEMVCMTPITKTEVVSAGDYVANLSGTGITSVKIMFRAYPFVGGKAQNINLSGALVAIS